MQKNGTVESRLSELIWTKLTMYKLDLHKSLLTKEVKYKFKHNLLIFMVVLSPYDVHFQCFIKMGNEIFHLKKPSIDCFLDISYLFFFLCSLICLWGCISAYLRVFFFRLSIKSCIFLPAFSKLFAWACILLVFSFFQLNHFIFVAVICKVYA